MKHLMILLLFSLLSPVTGFAHGIHDSGAAKPQKGGLLKSLETINLEFVKINDEIRIYIYDKSDSLKPLDTKNYPVSAKAVLPRNKGTQEIILSNKEGYWNTHFKAPNTHRYDFEFTIEQGGHTDKIIYTVEPKK